MNEQQPQDHHIALRLFVASVWLILLTFYMFLYEIDPRLTVFEQRFMLLIMAGGLGLFALTYRLLKQTKQAPSQESDTRTAAEKILGKGN